MEFCKTVKEFDCTKFSEKKICRRIKYAKNKTMYSKNCK